ncbi:MAG TPA: PspC domain-containing protein [Streptosporangiaceae bacterium]|nr:PspC domain-containing protein [Streptosporangiaceae bacterium]
MNDKPPGTGTPPTVPLTKAQPPPGAQQARPAPRAGAAGSQPPGHGCSGWQSHMRGGWSVQRPGGPLRRPQQGRLIGGVAAAIGARTGVGTNIIRTVFICSSLVGGFGAAVYVLAWLFVPAAGEETNIASRAQADRRGIALAAAAASLLALVLLVASLLHVSWLGSLSWPPVIALAGLVLIWRNASRDEQRLMRQVAEPVLGLSPGGRRSVFWLRMIVACVLLLSGVGILVAERITSKAIWPLTGVAVLLVAIVLLLGPWWMRILRDQFAERQARIRAEERAEMASRLHDSVLQTLALIQRRAEDPQQVVSLARAQERELRSWLFDGKAPGSMDGRATMVSDGIRLIQQEVEAQHGIVVEAISVGDCELDDDLGALLAAAREATVNSAKWSGAGTVSLFAEVEPATVSVYVRDRGRGFDPAAVPADRKGLAESVRARMERRGGSATVRSTPGEGTEVVLTMPRTAGQREPSPAT